jgi:hypothetical protein
MSGIRTMPEMSSCQAMLNGALVLRSFVAKVVTDEIDLRIAIALNFGIAWKVIAFKATT